MQKYSYGSGWVLPVSDPRKKLDPIHTICPGSSDPVTTSWTHSSYIDPAFAEICSGIWKHMEFLNY